MFGRSGCDGWLVLWLFVGFVWVVGLGWLFLFFDYEVLDEGDYEGYDE